MCISVTRFNWHYTYGCEITVLTLHPAPRFKYCWNILKPVDISTLSLFTWFVSNRNIPHTSGTNQYEIWTFFHYVFVQNITCLDLEEMSFYCISATLRLRLVIFYIFDNVSIEKTKTTLYPANKYFMSIKNLNKAYLCVIDLHCCLKCFKNYHLATPCFIKNIWAQ